MTRVYVVDAGYQVERYKEYVKNNKLNVKVKGLIDMDDIVDTLVNNKSVYIAATGRRDDLEKLETIMFNAGRCLRRLN